MPTDNPFSDTVVKEFVNRPERYRHYGLDAYYKEVILKNLQADREPSTDPMLAKKQSSQHTIPSAFSGPKPSTSSEQSKQTARGRGGLNPRTELATKPQNNLSKSTQELANSPSISVVRLQNVTSGGFNDRRYSHLPDLVRPLYDSSLSEEAKTSEESGSDDSLPPLVSGSESEQEIIGDKNRAKQKQRRAESTTNSESPESGAGSWPYYKNEAITAQELSELDSDFNEKLKSNPVNQNRGKVVLKVNKTPEVNLKQSGDFVADADVAVDEDDFSSS
ncbi:hypothetical protein BKA69DRAFT_1086750 [Paraphysoderma sedebokerense]|nr:hypothetical protein BKA69DRAFT_1086750 [Paraphysoderma sedebokerense]